MVLTPLRLLVDAVDEVEVAVVDIDVTTVDRELASPLKTGPQPPISEMSPGQPSARTLSGWKPSR